MLSLIPTQSLKRLPRRIALALLGCLLAVASLALVAEPAAAHKHKKLTASILSAEGFCEELTYPFCSVEGQVKIKNKRAKGTKALVICVGIDVHTSDHRSLSIEPPLPGGQAIARVKPGKSKTTTYRTVYDDTGGEADHLHITHVHKNVVHNGGKQC